MLDKHVVECFVVGLVAVNRDCGFDLRVVAEEDNGRFQCVDAIG